MRSIRAKILLWSLGTFGLSLIAFGMISKYLAREAPGPDSFFFKTLAMIDEEVCRAYEEGGRGRLAEFINRLDAYYGDEYHMLDARGRDLVDGRDWSSLIAQSGRRPGPPHPVGGGVLVSAHQLRGGRYHLVVMIRPRFDPKGILPYYGAVVLVIVLLGYALAVHLATPLRKLRGVVDRFGQGELSARSGSNRRDEIGELARSFDRMAGQIESLRAFERRLLQDVSHELRSPLARLGFNLELARMDEGRDAAFERIGRDLARLSSLVNELLQLTCAEAEGDASARRFEPVRLDELLGSLAEDCGAEALAKGCRIDDRNEGPVSLEGDGELLRRAIENLIRNAIRHAPEGSVIDVDLRTFAGLASITVRDQGPGVPESALESIFDPFFRVDEARSRSDGGAGLGLSIAQRSVEIHGGRIFARNARPGLLVTIELPIKSVLDTQG
ncbi:sensor histidine kinase [Tundrisphaera lichenicola]|uniref:sensor histidine kinase n=1 Tax=Tundrisphaera lichenicola TaxID=2029860 RepID=UPI003EBE0A59